MASYRNWFHEIEITTWSFINIKVHFHLYKLHKTITIILKMIIHSFSFLHILQKTSCWSDTRVTEICVWWVREIYFQLMNAFDTLPRLLQLKLVTIKNILHFVLKAQAYDMWLSLKCVAMRTRGVTPKS